MAVIEIAKIQVRRGQLGVVGMPRLDSGELGWAIDTQELYIGNGSVAEGAPAVGNTQIVTYNDIPNLFSKGLLYTYGSSNATDIYTTVDIPISTNLISRTLAGKLDDTVTVLDFGVIGDGLTDVTDRLQYAIDTIFNNSDVVDNRSRKPLRLPAGNYVVSKAIKIYPNTTLVGDGLDKTVLLLAGTNTNLIQVLDKDGNEFLEMKSQVSNIRMEGITFAFDNTTSTGFSTTLPLVYLDCVTYCQIVNCGFRGTMDQSTVPLHITGSSDNYVGIDIRSLNGVPSNNILIKDCYFRGVKYGIRSAFDIEDVVIDNNIFDTLNMGIQWAPYLALSSTVGPVRTSITNNIFTNVYAEGIHVGPNKGGYGGGGAMTNHVSAFNSFFNVGNSLTGESNATTPVIGFYSPGNVSKEDKFDRDRSIFALHTDPSYPLIPSISGHVLKDSNVSFTTTFIATVGPVTIVRIPYAHNDEGINLQYVASMPTIPATRKGILSINVGTGYQSIVTDDYSYIGPNDGGLSFSAYLNTASNVVSISYLSNTAGQIEYQYSYIG
jgi:hypothetical protein